MLFILGFKPFLYNVLSSNGLHYKLKRSKIKTVRYDLKSSLFGSKPKHKSKVALDSNGLKIRHILWSINFFKSKI